MKMYHPSDFYLKGKIIEMDEPVKIRLESEGAYFEELEKFLKVFDHNWNVVDLYDETKIKLHKWYRTKRVEHHKKYDDLGSQYHGSDRITQELGGYIVEALVEGLWCCLNQSRGSVYRGETKILKQFEVPIDEENKAMLEAYVARNIVEDTTYLQVMLYGRYGRKLKEFFADYITEEQFQKVWADLDAQTSEEEIRKIVKNRYPDSN